MAPHGEELAEKLKNLIVRLQKDGKGSRKIGDQLKISLNTVAAVMRRYRTSHSTTNQSHSGHPPKMTPRTVCYLYNLALKNRQASASKLAQGLSMEIGVLTALTVQRTLHNINHYEWHPENLACSLNWEHILFLTMKHGGGSVGEMTFIDGTMNACGYTRILADKLTPSLQDLGRRGIFQHDNYPKHTAKTTQALLNKKKSENYDLVKYVA
uniref:Uncharacterized protein n=1 Tax=Scleropages formosus TaxID=113540 RepID=A0A8C9UY38_SCLFO